MSTEMTLGFGGGLESKGLGRVKIALGPQPLLAFINVSIIKYGPAGPCDKLSLEYIQAHTSLCQVVRVPISWAATPKVKKWRTSGEQEALAGGRCPNRNVPGSLSMPVSQLLKEWLLS